MLSREFIDQIVGLAQSVWSPQPGAAFEHLPAGATRWPLPTSTELARSVDTHRLHPIYVRAYRDGRPIERPDVVQGPVFGREKLPHISGEKLLAAVDEGCTIAVDHVQHMLPGVRALCDAVAGRLGAWVHANAYLAGGRAQGLPEHRDTHDVVIVQCEGSRRWLFRSDEGEVSELTVSARDLLAARRGTTHAVHHDHAGSRALHLTLGIVRPRFAHVVTDALRRAIAADPTWNEEFDLNGDARELEGFLERAATATRTSLLELAAGTNCGGLLDLRRAQWME